MKTYYSDTAHGKIILAMQHSPKKEFKVSDFCKPYTLWFFSEYFVWYKANTRIWELCQEWIVYRSSSDWRFAKYMLTSLWEKIQVQKTKNYIEVIL